MKSPALILFIIFNMLAINLASADNVIAELSNESHQQQLHSNESSPSNTVDDSSCEHFCHLSSHLLGYISQLDSLPNLSSANTFFSVSEQFNSFVLDPPFQPPQA